MDTGLSELVVAGGKVTGVKVNNYGRVYQINANHGVVLAAGGFEWNQELRDRFFEVPGLTRHSSSPEDANRGETLIAGMKIIRKISAQPAIAPYVAEELVPGPSVQTDAELEAAIRQHGGSNMHPVGSCRMGPGEDDVVDPRLRVHGIGGLRIVDGSIMPTLPAGNTNAATIMIGEKGADMILQDAKT